MAHNIDFNEVRKEISDFDAHRELVINKSREIIKSSKLVIYAVHRDNFDEASQLVKKMDKEVEDLKKITKKFPSLDYSGSFKVAMQEYVEAYCYFEFAGKNKLPTKKELAVDGEIYLLGLCDLVGELVRRAVNHTIKGEYGKAMGIKAFIDDLYGQFLLFDFRNGELRKKFDGMRYDVKRLEDLALEIKLKKG